MKESKKTQDLSSYRNVQTLKTQQLPFRSIDQSLKSKCTESINISPRQCETTKTGRVVALRRDEPKFMNAQSKPRIATMPSSSLQRAHTINIPYSFDAPASVDKKNDNNETNGIKKQSEDIFFIRPGKITLTCSIKTLPSLYPLERNSLHLNSTIPLQKISCGIENFLRMNSISYSCCSENGLFDCLSGLLLVKFSIRLWKGEKKNLEGSGIESKAFIVEVQRCRGDTLEFYRIRNALFETITSSKMKQCAGALNTRKQIRNPDSYCRGKLRLADCQLPGSNQSLYSASDSLGMCLNLLESKRLDANQLGMESLLVATNPTIVSAEFAELISSEISSEDGLSSDIGGRLQNILCKHIQGYWRRQNGEMREGPDSENFYLWQMEALALRVFANILQTSKRTRLPCTSITCVLVKNVEAASRRPDEGALSARCLRHLVNEDTRKDLVGMVTMSAIKNAYRFGKVHHLFLEDEAQKLFRSLYSDVEDI